MSFPAPLMPAVAIATAMVVVVLIAGAASGVSPRGTTTRVSVASDGSQGNAVSEWPDITSDGRFVAFHSSASNLVPNDTNARGDIFLRDHQTGAIERVSLTNAGGQADSSSREAALSSDARYVAFESSATNLVPGDLNGRQDIFVRDRMAGTTQRVSVSSSGVEGSSYSVSPTITGDGRFVAFSSIANNLVPGDTNNRDDIFLHDRQTGITELVSVLSDETQLLTQSFGPAGLSADARFVAFGSGFDVFVRDRMLGVTEKMDAGSGGSDLGDASDPDITGDGRFVAFKLGGVSSSQIHLRDRQTGQIELVSVNDSGETGVGASVSPDLSADARFVTFSSNATNLEAGDTNVQRDVFVRDRMAGTTRLVSVATNGTQGIQGSVLPAITADGRFIAFGSSAPNLVEGDTNNTTDVFVHDRDPGAPTPTPTACGACTPTPTPGPPRGTTRVSVASDGTQANGYSAVPDINSDGRFVAFFSLASNLVPNDTNATSDIFLHDRQTAATERVSVGAGGVQGNAGSSTAAISADGRFIAFDSSATNLVASDGNGVTDIFVRDRMTGTTERISLSSAGVEGNAASISPAISGDGRFVAFQSSATNLVLGDTNNNTDIFLRDRQTGITELVSVDSNETQFAGPSRARVDLSADARYVTFVSGDDVWIRDRTAGLTEKAEVNSSGSDLGRANAGDISADGRFVAFDLCCPAVQGIYLRDR